MLFSKGKSQRTEHLLIKGIIYNTETAAEKVLFTVSKKLYRRAVDRNRIKRLMREAYRQTRPQLVSTGLLPCGLLIGLIYTLPKIGRFSELKKELLLSLPAFIVTLTSQQN